MPISRWRSLLANQVDHHDRCHDHQHDRTDVLVIVEADGVVEFLADPAGPDETDDRGGADVELEPPQRIGREIRQDLRQHREADHLEPVAARCPDAFKLALIDVLVGFRVEFPHRADSVQRERQEPRKRTDAESHDEDQRIDDFRNGARDLGKTAKKEVRPEAGDQVARGGEANQKAADRAEQRRHQGDEDGVKQ